MSAARKWTAPEPWRPPGSVGIVWCARQQCVHRLDPVLISAGWTMHPSCEFPELFGAASKRAAGL